MNMTNEDWKYRIINSSPKRLVIVTYEIILDRLERAGTLLDAGDLDGFRQKTGNAREFVSELLCSLNTDNSAARGLAELYMLVNRLLAKAYFQCCGSRAAPESAKSAKKLLGAAGEIIGRLMKGLETEVDDQPPVCAQATENYSFTGVYRSSARVSGGFR